MSVTAAALLNRKLDACAEWRVYAAGAARAGTSGLVSNEYSMCQKEPVVSQRDQLAKLISALKQQRNELALQVQLGKAEAREEWDKVTAKLDQLASEYEPLKDAVEETAGNVFSAMKLVAAEIQDGFHRIRKSL